MIELKAVGGYSEIGRNMTAVKYKDEVILLDMGVHLENYIHLKDDDDLEFFSVKDMIRAGAIPDDKVIKDWQKKVVAIIPSHGHLDHIGAIPFMAAKYDCPIICSPYTASVIRAIVKDKNQYLRNELIVQKLNTKLKITESLTVELLNMTHSIPDASLIVIHTPEGQVIYSNDFKLDDSPTLGDKPNYKRMKELGDKGNVKALVIDSLYADHHRKTPSESAAKEMLKDVMLNTNSKNRAMVVTTFSSHIARLKSIIEFGKKMNRKILFVGRSLAKYVYAAEDINLVNFSKDVDICNFKNQMVRKLALAQKRGRDKYLIVCTGHQGEPNAVLSKMVNNKLNFKLMPDDIVIFSCTTIPSETNIENRNRLDLQLMDKGVKIFKDIHASGHGGREDQRELISYIKPKNIIPGHAPKEKKLHMKSLAEEMGYKDKNILMLEDGDLVEF